MKMLGSLVIALSLMVCLSSGLALRQAPEQKCEEKMELPDQVQAALKHTPDVALSCRLKPSILQGDFDGDGRPDYAVVVTQQKSRKRGFLIVFGNGRIVVAGAGSLVKYGTTASPDLNFDQWELYSKARSVESAEHQKPLKLLGDALLVSHNESASGLFYWDGKRVRWYQQGD
jgi:hypothetical protein